MATETTKIARLGPSRGIEELILKMTGCPAFVPLFVPQPNYHEKVVRALPD
jgi:hypothetical protein